MGHRIIGCVETYPTLEGKLTKRLIIAHRGASACARENTLDAFKKAIDSGADMIEFDVRRTKNNVFIAYHDEHIQGEMVKELTYEAAEELAGRHGFSIPTVEEVLENTSGEIKLLVELKEEGYEKDVLEVLLKHFKDDDLIIASFNGHRPRGLPLPFVGRGGPCPGRVGRLAVHCRLAQSDPGRTRCPRAPPAP